MVSTDWFSWTWDIVEVSEWSDINCSEYCINIPTRHPLQTEQIYYLSYMIAIEITIWVKLHRWYRHMITATTTASEVWNCKEIRVTKCIISWSLCYSYKCSITTLRAVARSSPLELKLPWSIFSPTTARTSIRDLNSLWWKKWTTFRSRDFSV